MALGEIAGWVAAAFTLSAFSMRTMLPLRLSAIAANISFIVYGTLEGLMPVAVLHVILLPFNLYRLAELLSQTRKMRAARRGDMSLDWLKKLMKRKRMRSGEILFRKGDPPDFLYIIASGSVHLDEIDKTIGAGEVLGEMAFFSEARERTLTARCITDCEILRIDEAAFGRVYYQYPEFGLYLARLIVNRMLDNSAGVSASPDHMRPGPLAVIEPAKSLERDPQDNLP